MHRGPFYSGNICHSRISQFAPARIVCNLTAMKHIFIALTACAITASAQVRLQIMQTENSTSIIQTNIKMDQILQMGGQEIITRNSQTFTTEHTTKREREEDGTLEATATIKKWVSEWIFPGGITMKFDSAAPATNLKSKVAIRDKPIALKQLQPIIDLLYVIKEHPVTYIYYKSGAIKEVKLPGLYDKEVDPNTKKPKEPVKYEWSKDFKNKKIANLIKQEFNPDGTANERKQQQARLPNKVVSKGDTWVRNETIKLGGNQVMNFQIKYKYEGTITKTKNTPELHRITGQVTDVAYEVKVEDTAPLKVKNSQLKAAKTRIEILFQSDNLEEIKDDKSDKLLYIQHRGKFFKSDNLIQIKGNMTFEANGQELPGKLDLTIEQNNKELPKGEG
jgi:hypothetical protein